jgi:hypothetical protein
MFSWLLATTLLILSTSGEIIPDWNCWFNTYESNVRVTNLVFSYNNTLNTDVIVSSSQSQNYLTPSQFNGQQPDIFKAGYNAYIMTLKDVDNTLASGSIQWHVDRSVSVDQSNIVETQRCDIKYKGTCPLWIEHFCEDSSYCNGQETCFSVAIFGMLTSRSFGACSRPSNGVICDVTSHCNESALACISKATPPPPPPAPMPIYPLFHCWYYTTGGDGKMVVNLKMSYNNTASSAVARPLSMNSITPLAYDGIQPTLFYGGYNADVFLLSDTLDILDKDKIVWTIVDESLVLTADNITAATRCAPVLTDAPTKAPTSVMTPEPTQCSASNSDCSQYNSFCHGPSKCDEATGMCVLLNPLYSPCSKSSISTAMIVCVEHLTMCVASINCTLDSECNDGLLCNGDEYCVNNTCVTQSNWTCGEDYVCVEGVGCQVTNPLISNEAIAAIVGGVGLIVIVIVVMFCLYFSGKFSTKNKSTKKKK